MAVSAVNYQLRDAMDNLGVSHDAKAILTKRQFCDLLAQPEVATVLQEVGVDVIGLLDMADVIYEDKAQTDMRSVTNAGGGDEAASVCLSAGVAPAEQSGLTFADFIDVILNMRGTNVATVK